MKRYLAIVLVGASVLAISSCGSGTAKNTTPSTDTSISSGPATNIDAANNPSLADTAYEKNRTRPITDTMKKK